MIPVQEGAGKAARQQPKDRSRLRRTIGSVVRPQRATLVALLLAIGGGLVLAASFPPAGIWPLAPLGPALLVLALRRASLRGSFGIGLVFGVAFFFPLLSWVLNVAWYAWVALAAAEAVILGVLAIGQTLLLRGRAWPLTVAGWWVAAEALRDRWPWGGFPWGRIAMSQAGAPTDGWAAIGGTPLVTFVVALAGATLARLLISFRQSGQVSEDSSANASGNAGENRGAGKTGRRRQQLIAAGGLLAAIGVAVVPAAFTLDPVSAHDKTAEVAAIQGNVPQQRTLAAQLNNTMVTANHAQATEKLAQRVKEKKAPEPQLVVWPENSTDFDPSYDPQIYDEISRATDAIASPLLVGAILQNPVRNAGQLWLPGVGPTQVYVKRRLVPFGEVIPLRGLLQKITPLTQLQPVNFTAGHKNVVFRIGDIRLGDVICYEVGFDDLVRSDVTAGANLLAMQTNDATFERDGQTGETGQQLEMARMRAVEHDRSVVVASTTGYSAIVAPDGRLIEKSGTWQQAILESKVPLVTYTTLADRVGPWPEYGIVILTAAAAIVSAVAAARSRRPRSLPA